MEKKSIQFEDCFKTYTTDQDKAITPEETLDSFYKKVDSLDLKILNEVKRIDSGRLDIPVYFSVCGEDALSLTGTNKATLMECERLRITRIENVAPS
jgi:ribosomal protein S12 methylthiotransferase accessory factor